MLLEKDLQKLVYQLLQMDFAHIQLDGSDIRVGIFDKATKLSLSTCVYNGGNYIPKSVRKCVSQKAPFESKEIKVYLTVDEANFQIFLNYLGNIEVLNYLLFQELLSEFTHLVDEWRLYLDKHDKDDLVYIPIK